MDSEFAEIDWEATFLNEASDIKMGFMSALEALKRPLSVNGCCPLSIFDGCGGMSLALKLEGVPSICPWEAEKDSR